MHLQCNCEPVQERLIMFGGQEAWKMNTRSAAGSWCLGGSTDGVESTESASKEQHHLRFWLLEHVQVRRCIHSGRC